MDEVAAPTLVEAIEGHVDVITMIVSVVLLVIAAVVMALI